MEAEAMKNHFGAVADGAESQQEEIAALRQQLADMTAERDTYMRDYGKEQDRKREVAQKLAIVTKKLELAEACLAGDGALITGLKDDLAEREKQIKLYEQAILASWPEGAKGKAFDFWNAARILATTEPKP